MSYTSPTVVASGTTFGQFQAGGLTRQLEKLITANVATADPTVAATISLTGGGRSILNPTVTATVVATGGGQTIAVPTVQATASVGAASTGSLPAGTYYVGYTWVHPNGETTMGAGSPAASVSASITQGAGNVPTITFPNLPTGCTSINVYLSDTNGANTALVLYKKGITKATGATCSLDAGNWMGGTFAAGTVPPVSNGTAGACVAAATGNYFGYTWVHAHGETTLGASVSTVTTIATGNIPRVTIPALPTGALSANIYMSDTNGANTALVLVKTGVTGLTADITAATWNGTTFAAGTVQPVSNTTIGGLAPGVYYTNFTEVNGFGETKVSSESSTFTVVAQSVPTAQATGAGSSSGSTLPPGVYYATYTWVDANGNETTDGSAHAAESASITTTGTQILTVTYNDTLPGWAKSRNLYLTVAGGAAATETLYATGQTATTTVCSSSKWKDGTIAASAAKTVPTVNGTSVDIPTVTFPALQTGNTSRNLYLTAAGGATLTEVLYATGITTLTYDVTAAAPANSFAVAPPTVNSTGLTYVMAGTAGTQNKPMELIRAAERGSGQDVYRYLAQVVTQFNRGEPASYGSKMSKLRHAHAAYALLATACAEIGTLMDANPGTISTSATPIGGRKAVRTWP